MELEAFDDAEIKVEGEEIDQIMNDFGNINLEGDFSKSDVVFFVIDCYDLLPAHVQELTKVFEMYSNFLKNKIISSPRDKVGLIMYGTNTTQNNLKFQSINVMNELHTPTAKMIKDAEKYKEQAADLFKRSTTSAKLHEVLWVFDNEIKEIDKRKNFLRLFLFTANDNPHSLGSHQRKQAIAHARKLADVGVEIELFPLSSTSSSTRFDIRHFYSEIINFDEDQINSGVLDLSDKILNLEQRLKQKEFKKRALNRLLLKIGNDTEIGVKAFCLLHKAKKPVGIKIHARTNQPLQKVTKIISDTGEQLFESDIGHFYPLCGQKVRLSKNDMKKIKAIQQPGVTLIGFKPMTKLKNIHNYRQSYFLYPDEQYVNGSSKFLHALIERMIQRQQFGIAKFMPRAGSQLRFVALLPQREQFDQNHSQSPPGLNLIFLPYNDDLADDEDLIQEYKGVEVSNELVQVTKLLINNLTISNFDLRNFQNPSLQKYYATLQASALGQKEVDIPIDTMRPNEAVLEKCKDIVSLISDTLELDCGGILPNQNNIQNSLRSDDECSEQQPKKMRRQVKKQKTEHKQKSESDNNELEEVQTCLRTGDLKGVTVAKLKNYLKSKSLKTNGNKQELIDRALNYLMN